MLENGTEVDDPELGQLSAEWDVVSIEALGGNTQYGLSKRGEQNGPYPILRMNNIQGGRLVTNDLQYVELDQEELTDFRLNPGDILFNRTNSYELVGKTALFDCPGNYVCASYLVRLTIDPVQALPELLSYYLNFDETQKRLKQLASRGVSQSNINATKLRSLRVIKPPLPEQRAIAHILRAVQQAKEAAEAVVEATRQLKRSLLRHLFTYGPVPVAEADRVPLKETEIGPIPEHWKVIELGDHVRLATGGTPSREQPAYWNGDIPWVKTGEVNYTTIMVAEEYITAEGLENSNARRFPPGTLLVAMYGQGVTRGRVAFLGIEATTNQACAAIFPKDALDKRFLYFAFQCHYDRIRDLGHGANQRNLSMAMVKQIRFGLPPVEEQQQIAEALEPIDYKLTVEQARVSALGGLFRSLLRDLMTGRVRVHELRIVPEEAEA